MRLPFFTALHSSRTFDYVPDGRSRGIRRDSAAPMSPAEYWIFLCATGLLAIALLAPPRTFIANSSRSRAAGAFGTARSNQEPHIVQQKRANEPGRGRHADAPWQIPLRGWKDILWRTYQQIGEDRLFAVAAGVVFYGLLALFPAVTALVSLYGLLANAATITDHLASLSGVLPGNAIDIVQEQIGRLTAKSDARLGFGFVLSLAVALWCQRRHEGNNRCTQCGV
jgi:membrane protein